jgi:RNA polymerase-interacting CarD/CdnL/TRCF family regulator
MMTNYLVGEKVVHWVYGLGEIIQMDEKKLQGKTLQYYVVQIRDLTLWVPAGDEGESCLRHPTPAAEFGELFAILKEPGEPLPENRLLRKTQLADQLKDGKLASICRVVRDLTSQGREKKLNENDNQVLERARNLLLAEWAVSLAVPLDQAREELDHILGVEPSPNRERLLS